MMWNRVAVSASLALCLATRAVWAGHPVLVEGNCDSPVPGTTLVTPGTCGDFDGDGRIGTAEDTDGPDRIFGTLGAALGPGAGAAAGTGANANGSLIIVTSGRFAQSLSITGGANGSVTIEAAPGVEAAIDAILQADPAGGNATRLAGPGIVVNALATRRVTLRNLTIRNWASGVQVLGTSNVVIENCRLENNANYGIEIRDNSRVLIDQTAVRATGFRLFLADDFPGVSTPAPGAGISFNGASTGVVASTTISSSFGAGLENLTGSNVAVCTNRLAVFDNNPAFVSIDQAATVGFCGDAPASGVCPTPSCPEPVCPTPVVQGATTCKKCKTRGDETTCTKCTVALQ